MTKKNLPAKQGKSEVLREVIERGTGGVPKKGGYYEVAPGKFEPDAFRVQEEANEAKIETRIVHAEQTDKFAMVVAEAKRKDGVVVQGVVFHDYDTIMAKKIMEMFKKILAGKQIFWGEKGQRTKIEPFIDPKNPFTMSETGKMVPALTGMGMAKIMDDMLRFRDFSLRDAATKAMRIAQLKATNEDWRDIEEIQAEEEEVKSVNKGKEPKKKTQKDIDERKENIGKNASKKEERTDEEETQDEEVQEEEEKTEDTESEGEKAPVTEQLDDTDDLTKAELHEMTAEEIGKWAVKKLRKEEKDITGAEVGKILMKYNRKRWLSTRKFNQVKNWFMDDYMTG